MKSRLTRSVPFRLAGFAALLGLVLVAAFAVGRAIDPTVDESVASAGEHDEEESDMGAHGATATAEATPGLAVAQGGYRLVPAQTRLSPGARSEYEFRILDEEGGTVRDFEVEHERRMHLIVVRRDFAGFQHLHPEQRDDGSWHVPMELAEGGVYRVFADFAAEGASLTLATDLFAPGEFSPQPLPAPAPTSDAGDGYEVTLASDPPVAAESSEAVFTVTRNGREVGAVEPYLGADGHLVTLRDGDQAFLHTHPEGEAGGPGPISFGVDYPTPGRYRMFLQFKHGGEVRTAAFTQVVEGHAEEGEGSGGH